ncbi:MAG: penicillin-binding protein, partial [Deltaproteobacteria bacterium]
MSAAPQIRRRVRKAGLIGLAAGLLYVLVGPGAGPTTVAEAASDVPLAMRALHPERAPAGSPEELPAANEPAPYALPAAAIDPALAAVDGDKLVQVMDDGTRVELTLDPMLQRAAERSLEKYKVEYGVVVAIRPATGEILALAEHAELRPELRHLALQAEGPAASIFKLVTSAALLEMTDLQPDDTICTHGGLKGIGLEHLRANSRLDKKCQSFGAALGASNNPAFARWADQLLRPAQLQAMADRFLFNRRLPFLWGVAVSRARIPTGSRLGFARSAAGFEGTHMSPLHAALIVAAIANDGQM